MYQKKENYKDRAEIIKLKTNKNNREKSRKLKVDSLKRSIESIKL